MVSRSRLKSLLTGLALYTMAAAMVGYFGVNAYTGKYGLNARQELDQEIIALTSELARLKRERSEGEQRVSLLRSDRVDPDMLDERARYQLDYANPHDLVRTGNRSLIRKCHGRTEEKRRERNCAGEWRRHPPGI
jgi:cell division protein FtsB